MKLAILALCRLEKQVTIISSKEKYCFYLKEDPNFIQNSKPQKCLHCRTEKYKNNDMEGKVKIIINNISEIEWGNEIDKFLWLLEDNIEIYTAYDSNKNEIGQLLYEDYLTNKIYVKGIFIQNLKD